MTVTDPSRRFETDIDQPYFTHPKNKNEGGERMEKKYLI